MMHTFATQASGGGHVPQLNTLPHPSLAKPQVNPSDAQLIGSQPSPQWLGVSLPPHVSGGGHAPHWRMFPQPSAAAPH
jgi:hypothetical protein